MPKTTPLSQADYGPTGGGGHDCSAACPGLIIPTL